MIWDMRTYSFEKNQEGSSIKENRSLIRKGVHMNLDCPNVELRMKAV
ncbi:hypothetical protein [Clostridium culturomicium]|nr:hypothetical protein [Clostridium culturomicium]